MAEEVTTMWAAGAYTAMTGLPTVLVGHDNAPALLFIMIMITWAGQSEGWNYIEVAILC